MTDETRHLRDAVVDGVVKGVEKHWRYSKKSFDVRPEYLLTVAIAEALSAGFEGRSGMEAEILLEEPTWNVIFNLVGEPLGLRAWLKVKSTLNRRNQVKREIDNALKNKIGTETVAALRVQLDGLETMLADEPWIDLERHGRVDIFLSAPAEYRSVVEVKGFDPASTLIERDLRRIGELFNLNAGNNALARGFVVFPSIQDRTSDLNGAIQAALALPLIQSVVHTQTVKTGEDPTDGMPAYVVNLVEVSRATT